MNEDGQNIIEPGDFEVYVGGSQPDKRSIELMGKAPLKALVTVE